MSTTHRTPKDPAAKAQEAVDVLSRRLAKLLKAQESLTAQARALAPEIGTVRKRLEYAQSNPDLPKARPDAQEAADG